MSASRGQPLEPWRDPNAVSHAPRRASRTNLIVGVGAFVAVAIVVTLIPARSFLSEPPDSIDTAREWWLDWMLPWLWPRALIVFALVGLVTALVLVIKRRRAR